jgi:ubiquinone/menaquinone biosynthesis C-methylase UbiE
MTSISQQTLVTEQFGPRAESYLSSAVHAQGEDLEQLAERLGRRPGARALDLGCGGGHVAYRLAPLVEQVVAYDLAQGMLDVVAREAAQRNLTNLVTRQGDVAQLPFPDGSFDLVASRFSAHHWSALAAGLAEARRVLKPGGQAVFMDVVSPGPALLDTWLQAMELLRDPSHVRDYALEEWRRALAAAGFRPGEAASFRLRMDFPTWIKRINTPDSHAQAIRSLQARAGAEVAGHFAIEPDGSFTLDTMLLCAGAGQPGTCG